MRPVAMITVVGVVVQVLAVEETIVILNSEKILTENHLKNRLKG